MHRFFVRFRSLLVFALVFAAPAAALAADVVLADSPPPAWVQWGVTGVTALLAVVALVGPKLAALTQNTTDDAAVEWVTNNGETIKSAVEKVAKWADPKDPSVPPSPTNPAGTA